MNNAPMNILGHILLTWKSLYVRSRIGFQSHRKYLLLKLTDNTIWFSKLCTKSHFHQHLMRDLVALDFCKSRITILWGMYGQAVVALICIPPIINVVVHLLLFLSINLRLYFVKCLIKSLAHFLFDSFFY
jgi:hypothetical protein